MKSNALDSYASLCLSDGELWGWDGSRFRQRGWLFYCSTTNHCRRLSLEEAIAICPGSLPREEQCRQLLLASILKGALREQQNVPIETFKGFKTENSTPQFMQEIIFDRILYLKIQLTSKAQSQPSPLELRQIDMTALCREFHKTWRESVDTKEEHLIKHWWRGL